MTASNQHEWIKDTLESVPPIVFLVLWRSGVDLAMAGWIGTGLAAALLLGFWLKGVRHNPILLGMNIHLVVITPLIVGLFNLGAADLARTLVALAEAGVLISITAVGFILTFFHPRGFIGIEGLPSALQRAYSLILLTASAAMVFWSFANLGNTLISIGLPLMVLFGLRRFYAARARDRSGPGAKAGMAVAAAPGSDLD